MMNAWKVCKKTYKKEEKVEVVKYSVCEILGMYLCCWMCCCHRKPRAVYKEVSTDETGKSLRYQSKYMDDLERVNFSLDQSLATEYVSASKKRANKIAPYNKPSVILGKDGKLNSSAEDESFMDAHYIDKWYDKNGKEPSSVSDVSPTIKVIDDTIDNKNKSKYSSIGGWRLWLCNGLNLILTWVLMFDRDVFKILIKCFSEYFQRF